MTRENLGKVDHSHLLVTQPNGEFPGKALGLHAIAWAREFDQAGSGEYLAMSGVGGASPAGKTPPVPTLLQ